MNKRLLFLLLAFPLTIQWGYSQRPTITSKTVIAKPIQTTRSAMSSKLSGSSRMLYEQWLNDRQKNTTRSSNEPKKFRVMGMPQQLHLINGIDYVHCLLTIDNSFDELILNDLDVLVQSLYGSTCIALVPMEKLPDIADAKGVKAIELPTRFTPTMDSARVDTQMDKVRAGTGLNMPYTGKGVVVGIIDTGFDFTHPAFYNKDMTQYRVARVWDQTATGTAPEGFDYGNELVGKAQILEAKRDNETGSHGTHVAGMAAGGYVTSPKDYSGNAPDADLILVAANGDDTKLINGLEYIFNYADQVNKPCVVNLSWGGHSGPHDGTLSFDKLVDERTKKPGRIVVGSAGNEGFERLHLKKEFGVVPDTMWTAAEASWVGLKDSVMIANAWGKEGKDFSVAFALIDTVANEVVYMTPYISILNTPEESAETYLLGVDRYGKVDTTRVGYSKKYSYPSNNKPTIQFFIQNNRKSSSNQVICISIASKESVIHMWGASNCRFSDANRPYLTAGDNLYTVGELGGVGNNIISVGAYTTKNYYTDLQGNSVPAGYATPKSGMIAPFSSFGPTADERMKPDIAAPGNVIVSSVNSFDKNYAPDKNETVFCVEKAGKKWYYGSMQGTSMSAPFVTGVIATWLQADPTLTPDKIKSIFKETATQDEFTDNKNRWGYGKLNGYKGIQKLMQITGIEGNTKDADNSIILHDGMIQLFGIAVGNLITVFSADGATLYQTMWKGEPIPFYFDKGIYIIKAGEKVGKVVNQ